jgi:hypothetical protein
MFDMDIGRIVPRLLMKHSGVKHVELTGSRLKNYATEWSDWDFLVKVTDFEVVSSALPTLTKSLKPLSHLWDPLAHHSIYMMILRGPVKIDLIFDRPHQPKPPWTINSDTIAQVNSHFWDWILWIASKETRGMPDITTNEFKKMFAHLLVPLGCTRSPASVEEATREYLVALEKQESVLHVKVDPTLATEVTKGLRTMGFDL